MITVKTLKRFFGRAKPEPEVIKEVQVEEVKEPSPKARGELEPIYIKSMELRSLTDIQEVADELRAGNIMILDIGSFMNQDPEELKRAIDQLKVICQRIGGDVGRLTESRVIATPKFVNIQFKREA